MVPVASVLVNDKTPWSKYIDATSGGVFNSAIADRIGVDPATVGRWRTGAVDPKPRQVVAYARAYGQSPIGALIAAGYLSEGEVDIPVTSPRAYTLDDFSPLELAKEVVRRLAEEDRAAGEGEILPFKPTGRGGDVGGASEDAPQYQPDIAASDDDGWESRQEDENESP